MLSRTLGILELFVGIGAQYGGGALILNPSGSLLRMPLDLIAGTPFRSYLIPGFLLGFIVGGSNTAAGLLALRRNRKASMAGLLAGTILTGWIISQIALIGFLHWVQPVYLGFGLLTLALAAALHFRKKDQERADILE